VVNILFSSPKIEYLLSLFPTRNKFRMNGLIKTNRPRWPVSQLAPRTPASH
jgi:hypothetical protein